MATITAVAGATGSPLLGPNWTGGVAPGPADDAIISTTTALTLPAGATWTVRSLTLTPNAGVVALAVAATASLILGLAATYITCLTIGGTADTAFALVIDGSLYLKGGVAHGNRPVELGAGSLIEYDRTCAHAAADPFWAPTNHLLANGLLVSRKTGTGATSKTARHTIQSSVAGTNANFRFAKNGTVGNGMADLNGVDLNRLSRSGLEVFELQPNGNACSTVFQNVRTDTCPALFTVLNVAPDGVVDVNGLTERNPVDAATGIWGVSGAARTTGVRRFKRVRTERTMNVSTSGITIQDYVFDGKVSGAVPFNMLTGAEFDAFEDVIWRDYANGGIGFPSPSAGATPVRRVLMHTGFTNFNGGYFSFTAAGHASRPATTYEAQRVLYQDCWDNSSGTIGEGDQFCIRATNLFANAALIKLRNCLGLNAAYDRTIHSAELMSPLGNQPNVDYDIEHCTVMSTFISSRQEAGIHSVGESQTADHGHIVTSSRSNIAWAPVGKTSIFLTRHPGFNQQDLMDPAICTHNAIVRGEPGYLGAPAGFVAAGGPALFTSATAPNANGITADPAWADPRLRDFALWVKDTFGDQGSVVLNFDKGFLELFKANDPTGFNTAAEISRVVSGTSAGIIDWIEAGWAPTAAAYHNTAHDGTDIGAVAYAAAGGAGTILYTRQPGGAITSGLLSPQPRIESQIGGVRDTTDTRTVTVGLVTVSGGPGILHGTTSAPMVAGAYDPGNLYVDGPGTYRLSSAVS